MMRTVDLGPCQGLRHDQDAGRWVVLLPGQFYPTRAPALWFAREAAMARGWSALEVLGEPGRHENPLSWERECAQRALEHAVAEKVLVIGKSMASLLAGEIVERELPAVWLTPLLNEPSVLDALSRARRPALLAGGDADPTWRVEDLPDNSFVEVLAVAGVDHAVQVPGDPAASLKALERLTDAVGRFVERL